MHARLQVTVTGATMPPGAPDTLVDTIAGHPGFAGLYLLEQDGGGHGTLLTLWATDEDARRASERTAAQLGPRPTALASDEVYEVARQVDGAAAGEAPAAASILWFDGPLSEERIAAAARANDERIIPAVAALPGNIGAIELWDPAARSVAVVLLATTPEALAAMHDGAMATKLLPGEDPALIPEADRLEQYRVVASAIPEGAVS